VKSKFARSGPGIQIVQRDEGQGRRENEGKRSQTSEWRGQRVHADDAIVVPQPRGGQGLPRPVPTVPLPSSPRHRAPSVFSTPSPTHSIPSPLGAPPDPRRRAPCRPPHRPPLPAGGRKACALPPFAPPRSKRPSDTTPAGCLPLSLPTNVPKTSNQIVPEYYTPNCTINCTRDCGTNCTQIAPQIAPHSPRGLCTLCIIDCTCLMLG